MFVKRERKRELDHLHGIILQNCHEGLVMLVGEMWVEVTGCCLLPLIDSGWSIGLEWEVCWWENVKTWKDSLNFRKTGEAALWVCWRGGSNYDGVGMYLLLLPLSSVCQYACLPHPSTFKGSWRGSELPAGRKQHALTGIAIWLSPEIKTFCLFTLSNILKVLITNNPWSLSSSAV